MNTLTHKETIPTNLGEISIPQTISVLQLSSYCYNRLQGLTPEQLKKLGFANAEVYEQVYQQKTTDRKPPTTEGQNNISLNNY